MDKRTAKTIRNTFIVLSDYMSNPGLLAALEKAGKDKQILRMAKANPKEFFKHEGVPPPPPRADVTIAQVKVKVTGKITVTLKVCVPIPLGGEICTNVKVEVDFP